MANRILTIASKLSLGFVLILVWGWMWIKVDTLFPVNTEAWRLVFLTYLIFATLIFAFEGVRGSKTESDLFRVGFLKAFPKFLIAGGITGVILFVVGFIIKGSALPTISQALIGIGFGVILLHALMVSVFEELVFRGWIPEQLKSRRINKNLIIWIQAVIFALFHALMGKSFLTMLIYVPLGIMFYWVKMKWSPRTNMANAGCHFMWNLFILGFLS